MSDRYTRLQRLHAQMAARLATVRRERAEQSLYEFLKQAWAYIDPAQFVGNWHLGAMAEHLEAVSHGQIKRLVINIPPRHGKTSLVTVCWPTWTWAQEPDEDFPLIGPQVAFLCASYGATKAEEDGVSARRLIGSEWFQQNWGKRVVICFPGDQAIQTERGSMPIGEIVKSNMEINVPSWSEINQAIELRPVVGWHRNPGAGIIKLSFSDGLSVRCTANHKFRMVDGDWKAAIDIPIGTSLPVFCHRTADIGSGVRPLSTASDVIDSVFANGIPGRKNTARLQTDTNIPCDFVCDPRIPTAFAGYQSSVDSSVSHVFGASTISEVNSSAIGWDAVQVSDILPRFSRAKKSQCDNLMEFAFDSFAVAPEIKMGISMAINGRFHEFSGRNPCNFATTERVFDGARQCSDPAKTGDFIPGKIWDRDPQLVCLTNIEYIGHVSETFCITVEKNNNFLVGDNQAVIAANCRDRDNQGRFDNTAGGSRINTGIPESLGKGGLIRILDDPHKTKEVESPVVRQGVIRSYDEVWRTRSNDSAKGAEVLVMQRLAADDLTGHLLEEDVEHLCLPALYESHRVCVTSLGFFDPRTEEDEPLWPGRFSADWLANHRKGIGPFAFAAQYQQIPEARGGTIIKRDWWNDWTAKQFPPMHYIIASLDTGMTEKDSSDPSALTIWGSFHDSGQIVGDEYNGYDFVQSGDPDEPRQAVVNSVLPKVMLMHAWQERLELPALVERVLVSWKRWKFDTLVIENKAHGHAVLQSLRSMFSSKPFSVLMFDPRKHGDKTNRLYAVQHLFSEGIVYAPLEKEWAEMVINQMALFPNAANDDLVDSSSQALHVLRQRGFMPRKEDAVRGVIGQMRHKARSAPLYPV